MRKPIVAGNWKMHNTVGESIELAAEVKRHVAEIDAVEIVLCPPFTALKSVGDLVRYGNIGLGAQTVHPEPQGAFTGEISTAMLSDLDCAYVVVGHSERRTLFGETDAGVRRKVEAVLDAGMRPIVCVGETLEQRDAGQADDVVREQVRAALTELNRELRDTVVAYEPVWAIGTGRTASPETAQAAHALIRATIAELATAAVADEVRIQYGGSVKPDNAVELFGCPDIDGGLIGGAALDAGAFVKIVRAML
ncbi:MAG: triose-phosphate isomerase [bacterium]|nr:triose-phosphate isomerase [bacterium]